MPSPTPLDNLEAALERAIARFEGGSATGVQIRYHLGFGNGGRGSMRAHAQLVLAVAEEEGGDREDAFDAACAVEIVHELTRVHDDIEDEAATRRGRETVWARFGVAHGINAGDALCAVAHLALLDGTQPRPPARTIAMTRALHEAQLAMCGGQARAIACAAEPPLTLDAYRATVAAKSALFGAACELGAFAAGNDGVRAAAYGRLGRACGVAYQIDGDIDSGEIAALRWSFSVEAARAVAQEALEQADAIAREDGVDRSGAVRAFCRHALRSTT